MKINIKEILKKNSIFYKEIENDLVINCPACKKASQGNPIATFHIDQTYHRGNCNSCSYIADWKEISEKLGIISIPEKEAEREYTKNKKNKGKALTACFADIQSVPISWLWEGRIAIGKITIIAGDPGLGKSLLTATLAAHVSQGYPWPVDQSKPPVGDVILISAEDDPADTIRPRLEAAKADCSRIHVLKGIQEEDPNSKEESIERMFSFKRDIATLEELLSGLPDCRLVIIDPISAYLGGTDSNKNSDIRELLAPLSALAQRHKAAFVLISHLNKNSGENAMYRTTGSLAFIAAARTAYIVARDQENTERRLFMPIKNNIAKDNSGLAYSIISAENGAPVITWEPEAIDITPEEALAPFESKEERTATDDAVDFLLDLLANGPVKGSDAHKEAREADITPKTLRLARKKLGIKTERSKSFEDRSRMWSLSQEALQAQNAPDNHTGKEGILDNEGHLGNASELDKLVDDLKSEGQSPEKLPF